MTPLSPDNSSADIIIKPTAIFAFLKTVPLLFFAASSVYLANRYYAPLILVSLATMLFALYRYLYIRQSIYLLTRQYIRITRGIFFKRLDTVDLIRVKDYTITEPFFLQIFRLMNLHLKTTDPETPVLWLRGIPRSDIVDTIRARVFETRLYNHIYKIN